MPASVPELSQAAQTAAAAAPAGCPSFASQLLVYMKNLRAQALKAKAEKAAGHIEKILAYARETEKITNHDVRRLTGLKRRQATKYLDQLVDEKKLVRFGTKRGTFYKPVKEI